MDGSSVPGIVGYEYDKVWNNGFSPVGLTVLSNSPVHGCCGGFSSNANSTLYIASSGARVFAAGTIQWSWGLANVLGNTYANAGIQQTTANILNNFINSPTPGVYLNPGSLSFGTLLLNTTSAAQTVTLTNNGTATLTLGGISVTGSNASDFAETDNCPANQGTMAVGASCTINVTFTPSATGMRNAALSVADNAVGSPQAVPMSGNGTNVDAPAVSLNPSSLTFSSQLVGTTSASQAVTLTDNGTQPLAISSINLSGTNAGDFVQTNNCPVSPSTLAANSSCAVTVTFTPGDAGLRSATITLTDNALDSPQSLALSGSGTNVLFSDGFESGRLPGNWTSKKITSGNKLGLDKTLKHSGSASLKSYVVNGVGGNAYVSKTINGQTTLDVRGYYYLNSPVNTGAVNLLSLYGQGSLIGWVTYTVSPTSPTLTVKNASNSTVYTCSGAPSLNAWHSLELQYVLSATSAGSFTVWLDGVQVCGAINISTAQSSGQTIDTVRVGSNMSDNTVGLKMHVDDVVVSRSYIGG